MPPNDHVDSSRLLRHLHIEFVPDMRHRDDPRHIRSRVDLIDSSLHNLNGIEEMSPCARFGNGGNGRGGDADNGEIVLLEDVIRDDGGVERGIIGVDVGTNGGEGEVGQELGEIVVASVEFVVAGNEGVETELVDCFANFLSAVVGKEQGSLAEVVRTIH